MSYILDALKKSEQQRGHGTAPSVQTLHSTGLGYDSNKTHLWPYILLAAIVINLAALLYFIITDSPTDSSISIQHMTTDTVRTEPGETQFSASRQTAQTPLTDTAETIVYKPVSIPANKPLAGIETYQATEQTNELATERAVENVPAPFTAPQNVILQRDELPADVQQHIPVMEFSAHVYSTNPLHRSIVINGRFMEEGDKFASDILLSEITPDGAIFNYQGQLFHQRVVSSWN